MFNKEYREWYEIAVKLIKNKDLYELVYDTLMKECISAVRSFRIFKNGEYTAVKGVNDVISLSYKEIYLPDNYCSDILTKLSAQAMSIETVIYRLFRGILYSNYSEFLRNRKLQLIQGSPTERMNLMQLSQKAVSNFALEYPCEGFYKEWEVKSARYVLSGKHRKEVELNVW